MPVDTTHPEYNLYLDVWQQCRSAHVGNRAVQDAGTTYLPKLPGMSDADYDKYRKRADFEGFTGRTVDAYTGMVFRNEPQVEAPDEVLELLRDVTDTGVSFRSFAETVVEDVIVTGRGGILVDYTPLPEDGTITRAQADTMGLRPYWRWYRAEDIYNWKTSRNGSRGQDVVMVVLREIVDEYVADEFTAEAVVQYRVLDISEGKYRQRLFRAVDNGWEPIEESFPQMNGMTLNYIPFVFVGPKTTTPDVDKPTIEDLVYLNFSHYRTMASYKHAEFFAGLPTPVITGVSPDFMENPHSPKSIGPSVIWSLPEGADAKFLQTDTGSLGSFREELARLTRNMAALGARILAEQGRAAESGEALSIRSMGENSVLASLARSVSDALQTALVITAEWVGVADTSEISVTLNTDFLPVQMTPQEMQVWIAAVQSGEVPAKLFREAMRKGEMVRADYSDDAWEGDLEESGGGLDALPRSGE